MDKGEEKEDIPHQDHEEITDSAGDEAICNLPENVDKNICDDIAELDITESSGDEITEEKSSVDEEHLIMLPSPNLTGEDLQKDYKAKQDRILKWMCRFGEDVWETSEENLRKKLLLKNSLDVLEAAQKELNKWALSK